MSHVAVGESGAPEGVPKSLRILIVADHASAQFGGEAILPLHYFRVLRQRGIEAWLIVHSRTRDELIRLFKEDQERIHFIADNWFHKLMYHLGKWVPEPLSSFTCGFCIRLSTQLEARREARRMIKRHGIDIVHQPIPVSPKESSVLHGLGVPVVIGPMNGGMSYPPAFARSQRRLTGHFMWAGKWLSGMVNRLMPGKLKAEVLLVANDRTSRALPPRVRGRIMTLVENGVDLSIWPMVQRTTEASSRTRFAFCGRLVDWKAVDILLDAFGEVAGKMDCTLDIVGDGPMRQALESQVDALGLRDRVVFHGWLSQPQCAVVLRGMDSLVLPSLHECGGAVVLEAMALGLPVIASDWGGPPDYLDATCGILVFPRSRELFVEDLSTALLRLAKSPELRRAMGEAGRRKVEARFDWERKVDKILGIFEGAVCAGKAR